MMFSRDQQEDSTENCKESGKIRFANLLFILMLMLRIIFYFFFIIIYKNGCQEELHCFILLKIRIARLGCDRTSRRELRKYLNDQITSHPWLQDSFQSLRSDLARD